MILTETEKNILKPLAHFDVLDYPLTLLEIQRYSGEKLAAGEISAALNGEALGRLVGQRQGLYFLTGREAIIASRLTRYRLAVSKLKKAARFARLFSLFPWIRAVAIYSSLSLKNSRADGDLDFFFITAADRAWSARFFINSFLKIFRLRPTPQTARDQLCASYWVDENNLDLSIANFDEDYFYTYGCAAFCFMSGSTELKNNFYQANDWIKTILPNWQPNLNSKQNKPTNIERLAQRLLEFIFQPLSETAIRKWQLKIMPEKYSKHQDGKKIITDAGVIKLHDNDKRSEYNRRFKINFDRLINYGD
ncbi:MAG: hypothetical protein WC517_01670 [Patescibacteria group bacterium]